MLGDFSNNIILPIPSNVERPLWSVMIPTYNPKDYIFEAIESVLVQFPEDGSMQIEVVDDCSGKVDIPKILEKIGDKRISYYRNPRNVGHSFNFTEAVRRSRGLLVHLLHDDDLVRPGFYKKFEEILETYSEVGAAYCRQEYIDDYGNTMFFSEPDKEETGILDNALIKLAERQRIQYCSMVVRRSTYEKVGGFVMKNIGCEDWEMWVRIASQFPVAYEPEALAKYRIHTTSMTLNDMRTGQDMRFLREAAEIFTKYLPEDKREEVTETRNRHYGRYSFGNVEKLKNQYNDEKSAAAQLTETMKLYPQLVLKNREFLEEFKIPVKGAGVTVILCTYNNADTIERTLRHLLIQKIPDYLPWEVMICDAGSGDQTIFKARETWLKYGGRFPLKVFASAGQEMFKIFDEAVSSAIYENLIVCRPGDFLSRDYVRNATLNMLNDRMIGALSGYTEAELPEVIPSWFRNLSADVFEIGEQYDNPTDVTWTKGKVWKQGLVISRSAWQELIKKGYQPAGATASCSNSLFGPEFFAALRSLGWRLRYSVELRSKKRFSKNDLKWNRLLERTVCEGIEAAYAERYKVKPGKKADHLEQRISKHYIRREIAKSLRYLKRKKGWMKKIYPESKVGDLDFLSIHRHIAVASHFLSKTDSYNERLRILRRYASKQDLLCLANPFNTDFFRYPAYRKNNDLRGVSVFIDYSGESDSTLAVCLERLAIQDVSKDLPWEVVVLAKDIQDEFKFTLLNKWERSNCNAALRFYNGETGNIARLHNSMLDSTNYDNIALLTERNFVERDFVRIANKLSRSRRDTGIFISSSYPESNVKFPSWFVKNKDLYSFFNQPEKPVLITDLKNFYRGSAAVFRRDVLLRQRPETIGTDTGPETLEIRDPVFVLTHELFRSGHVASFEPRLRTGRFVPLEDLKWANHRKIYFGKGIYEGLQSSAATTVSRLKLINESLGKLFRYPLAKLISKPHKYRNDSEVLEIERIKGNLKLQLSGGNGIASVSGSGLNGIFLPGTLLNENEKDIPGEFNPVGVSVVICCYNSSELLPETLRKLFNQDVPSHIEWEIIVVDNASTDNTARIAQEMYERSSFLQPFKVVHESEPGLSNARKKGFESANYEFVILCDDDNHPESDYVKRAYDLMMSDESIGIAGGQSRGKFESEPPFWFDEWKNSYAIGRQSGKSEELTGSKRYVWGACMIVRRSAFQELNAGNFSSLLSDRRGTSLTSGGDTELCFALSKLGYKIHYDSGLKFSHYITENRMKWDYLLRLFNGFGIASHGLDVQRKQLTDDKNVDASQKVMSHKYELLKSVKLLRKKQYRRFLSQSNSPEGISDAPMAEYTLGRIQSIAESRGSADNSLHLLKRSLRFADFKMMRSRLGILYKRYPAYSKSRKQNGVSIVICTFNGAERLPQTLSYIAKQVTHPDLLWELIIVDNASTDDTKHASLVEWSRHKCSAPLRIVDEFTQGLSAARHKGFQTAKYNYIVLCDDDNWLDSKFVQTAFDIMDKDRTIGVLGGPSTPQFEEHPPEWYKWFQHGYAAGEQFDFNTNKISEGDITWKRGFVWGAGMVLRKKAVDELYAKGFKSIMSDRKGYQLSSGGDSELCYALALAGWKIWYDSRLTCYHLMPSGRVTWNYLIRLFQGFGITSVGLDPYEKAIMLSRADIVEKEILSKNWKYEFRKTLKELRESGLRRILAIRNPQENNTKVPMIEYNLTRLQELWRVRKEYDRNLKSVLESGWRADKKFLKKRHRDFVETENDYRYGWPWQANKRVSHEPDSDSSKLPKISVLSPSFNSQNTIEKAILSVLNQGYENFEHIICDGGSKDRTVDIIRKYPHIKWVSEPDNGQCDAMNKAFRMATGDVITYLNVDDYFQRDAFSKVAKAFTENPDADMVVGNLFFDENGQIYLRNPVTEYKKILQPYRYIFPINPVCYFYKRKVQEAAGPFPLDNHFTMDYWFLLKAFQSSNIVKINSNLGTFWMNGFNKTSAADNRKNVHKTALQHLLANDLKTMPFYLFNYYKHYYYDTKPYNLKKLWFKARKNLVRIYSIVTFRKNKYYSNRLYDEARSNYYLGRKAKAFAIINLSFIVYPKGLKQRSRQSLAVQSMLSSRSFEKLKFLYFFFTTPPGVPLGNKLDYFGRKHYGEGRKVKGRTLLMLSYITSPKFLLDENHMYAPVRNKTFGYGPLSFVNPLNWIRAVYGFIAKKKNRSAAYRFYERSGRSYNEGRRFRAFAYSAICFIAQPSSAADHDRMNLLLYSFFGETHMNRWHTIRGIYKENPEYPFAQKLNYYGNQQRKEGHSAYGNSLLLFTYLISPKYILKREKIKKAGIVVSSQKVDFKVKTGRYESENITASKLSPKSILQRKTEVKSDITNSLEMSRYRLQLAYDYFRYRKFKAKSKYLYSDAQDFYFKDMKSKVPGLVFRSFLLYPPSLLNRNKWSLLINSVLSDSQLRKIKNTVKRGK